MQDTTLAAACRNLADAAQAPAVVRAIRRAYLPVLDLTQTMRALHGAGRLDGFKMRRFR